MIENEPVTDDQEIVNQFSNYFSRIADKILKTRKYDGNKSFAEYLQYPLQNSHIFFDCDAPEVKFLIASLQTNKSTGPNSIPVELLQLVKMEVAVPLSKIFNLSMRTGIHPELLRIAKTIPIHKKGSKLEVSNYRPISLLSNINELIEKNYI